MTIYVKICSKCQETKSITDFYKKKDTKDGHTNQCKECINEFHRLKRELIRLSKPAKPKVDQKQYQKEYREKNKEVLKIKAKERLTQRMDQHRDYCKKYQMRRKQSDPLFKLIQNTRSLIATSLRKMRTGKKEKTEQILGCSFEEFKTNLESKFLEGMSWDNRYMWHVDHIIPVSYGTTEEEIIALNHYTNLQPLWAVDNIRKKNRYIG